MHDGGNRHLYLKANGADVQGESTQTSLGRENSIECLYFESGCITAREAGSGTARRPSPAPAILIRKAHRQELAADREGARGQQVIEGTFKFFRPRPTGDGTTEQFYTVKIEGPRRGPAHVQPLTLVSGAQHGAGAGRSRSCSARSRGPTDGGIGTGHLGRERLVREGRGAPARDQLPSPGPDTCRVSSACSTGCVIPNSDRRSVETDHGQLTKSVLRNLERLLSSRHGSACIGPVPASPVSTS